MAKVVMPLMSASASGKFAKSIVAFGWKGINVMRQLVTPANPQSAGQGNIRVILGNLGRAVGMIVVGKTFDVKLKALGVIPNQQTKQSYLVQYIKDTYLAGSGATLASNFSTQLAALKAHTKSNAFRSGADDLTLTSFDLAYKDIASFDKGLGVYLIAKAAIALAFTGEPYTTALASWTATQVDQLVSDMITA